MKRRILRQLRVIKTEIGDLQIGIGEVEFECGKFLEIVQDLNKLFGGIGVNYSHSQGGTGT